jgi:CO/xanthine dehydrogenase FAD-binding subunit
LTGINPRRVWRPTSIDELIHLQQEQPALTLLAGGTVALPAWQNEIAPKEVIYLPSIPELHDRGPSWCGSAVTLAEIAEETAYPATLREAAASIASPAIRNIATLGGNIANPGDRCLLVALLALDAWVEYLDPAKGAIERLSLIYKLPDTQRTIIRVGWPVPDHSHSSFTKFGVRALSGMNLATVALHLSNTTCFLAVGATGVAPHRLPQTERLWQDLLQQTERAAVAMRQASAAEVQVQEVDLVPASYRKEVVGVLIERALRTFVKEGEL